MARIESWFNHDLQNPVKVQYLDGNVFSADNEGNIVGVNVYDNTEPATLGGSVSANVVRADGTTVAVTGTLSENHASVILPQAAYAVPGVVSIIIKLTDSGVVTTMCAVVANVYRSTTDTVVDPGTIIPSVQDLIDDIDTAIASIPADYSDLLAAVASDYSSSKTYPVVGSYAWYDGVLKRSIVPITTAESYTAAHWTNAVIGDDICDLKSAMYQSTGNKRIDSLGTGKYIATTGNTVDITSVSSSSNYKSYSITQCNAGDVFTYSGNTTEATAGWAFIDNNGSVLARAAANKAYTDEVLIAPANSAYLVTNSTEDIEAYYGKMIRDDVDAVSEKTKNLWRYGDVYLDTNNKVKVFENMNLPAGTYTLSAEITSTGSAKCRMAFYKVKYSGTVVETDGITPNNGRQFVTFTIDDTFQYVRVRNGLAETSTNTVVWRNIQIETGSKMTDYAPYETAVDSIARESEKNSNNLWEFGDVEFTTTYTRNINLSSGNYVFSALAENKDDPRYEASRYRVDFLNGSTVVAYNTISGEIESSFYVVLSSAITAIKFYAANASTTATDHKAKYSRIQIIAGKYNKNYFPYELDGGVIAECSQADPNILCKLENIVITRSTKEFKVIRKTNDLRNIIIECKAKWTGTESDEYHIPEVRFFFIDDARNTTGWYNIGAKGYTVTNQYRVPAFPGFTAEDQLNVLFIQFSIPSGLTLTIENMVVTYENSINKPFLSGMRIDSHGDWFGYPSMSIHALKSAQQCGATNFIVVPKVSSDGVWFAYHDDTFDESTTLLRNADGTAITGSQYNGLAFNQIPWSWLKDLDSGAYRKPIWAGTHLMKISTMLEICNATGVHPVFSWHPTSTLAETESFYDLLKTYQLTDKTTILPESEWFTNVCFPVFGNELEMYKFGLTLANTSAENLATLITRINNTDGLDKSKVCIALWVNKATTELIQMIKTAGFKVGLHSYRHTTPSGKDVDYLSEGDYLYFQRLGVSVFTDGHNSSIGLDW